MSKNICIKFREYDLLRLIPMRVGDDYDFKLEFMNNEFKLRRSNPLNMENMFVKLAHS